MHPFRSACLRVAPLLAVLSLCVGAGALASACGGAADGTDGGADGAADGADGAAGDADGATKDSGPAFGACPSEPAGGAVCAGLCGNGRADSCTVGQGRATSQLAEECDGADVRGETCESRGYLGGSLRCSAGCRVEVAGCNATRDGFSTIDLAPNATGFAAAAMRGTSVAVAWSRNGGLIHLGFVVDRGLVESALCFGSEPPIRMGLVATTEGFALMTSYSNGVGTDVFRLDPSAKLLGTRHFPGLGLAELATRSADGSAGEGTLLTGRVGKVGIVTEVRWLRADLTDAHEPQKIDYPGASDQHALSFGDTILLAAQTNDSKLVFTRLLPDGSQTTRIESGLPFTSGWLGRRGNTGLLTRYDGQSGTTLEAYDDSGTSSGVVRQVPGQMFPPRAVGLGGRPFAIAAEALPYSPPPDAGVLPPGVGRSVVAHAMDGPPEARPLMAGPDASVLGTTWTGDLVVLTGGTLRLLTPK